MSTPVYASVQRSPGPPKQGSYGGPQHPVSVALSDGAGQATVYADVGPLSYLQAGDWLLIEPKQRGNGYRVSSTQAPELTATLQQRQQQNPALLTQLQPAPPPAAPSVSAAAPVPITPVSPYSSNGNGGSSAPTESLSPERRRAIAEWLRSDAAPLYGYCSKLAAEHLGDGASPLQLGAAADCLFNAARDRFGF